MGPPNEALSTRCGDQSLGDLNDAKLNGARLGIAIQTSGFLIDPESAVTNDLGGNPLKADLSGADLSGAELSEAKNHIAAHASWMTFHDAGASVARKCVPWGSISLSNAGRMRSG